MSTVATITPASRLNESTWRESGFDTPTYPSFFGTFDGDTANDAIRAEVLLSGIESVCNNGQAYTRYDRFINRVELIWHDGPAHKQRRGAILFSCGGAQVHFMHALVGYGGNGPTLSRRIFQLLSAEHVFNEINQVAGNEYHYIVSRETYVSAQDALTGRPVGSSAEWTWCHKKP